MKSTILGALSAALVAGSLCLGSISTAYAEQPYEPIQAVDGFGAIFVGVAEPFLFPIDQAKTCKRETGDQLYASGCAFVGFLVSPFLLVRDVLLGTGDILTGGYFKLSRKAGVFNYFKDEELPAEAAAPPDDTPEAQPPPRKSKPKASADDLDPAYRRY